MPRILATLVAPLAVVNAGARIGRAVDSIKSGCHKNRSQRSVDKARKASKDAG